MRDACAQGIAHRDIKMANFLLESDSDDAKLKMIDFGFSKIVRITQ